ncbi:diguanylate cyclase/phosphodiesterase (GGDEF & EAL domains) with PAS/PAC sensor(s) [hydrothermal vent metagenome]|uniref:Diguanylate cyclase/phosphodiesterase (GGDEF & EAL domains) with PAS/PAC sensor(S) n=1 Tax=hydrothermal vent metagenome TaxID=652676 RepID=A0A3B0YDP2_9ZZZZ
MIAFIIGFILILISQRTIKRLTQPLYSISDVMQKTEQGEYVPHIDVKGTLEVHHIAEAYNRMISALAERDEKLREHNVHLEKQAMHDHLTGLINRIGFEQALKLAIDECKTLQSQHALCYMDLDKFKIVNDSCGHNAGDQLLQNIGGIFRQHIRKDSDSLARVGGDEFALILKNCSIEKAQAIGESICKDVENYRFHWEENVFSIGVSIGITQLDSSAASLRDVIAKVDSACYIAKERGRGQVHVIHPEDEDLQSLGSETQIANTIIDCLDNDGFELFCQPIKHLRKTSGQKHRYEILLRMKDENGQQIPPDKFISSAERYNLMIRIDQWVLSQTLQQLSNNKHFINTLDICTINISASSLNDNTFSHFIRQQLIDKNINPDLICFEINETIAISNISNTLGFVQNIHKLGCHIMLDDFVSSSSSFSHIKSMDIDYLKIDGDFFKDFTHNPVSHAMVKSINEIAHILHIETIAEHIETRESLNEATRMGIDYAQGYYIARPAPLIDIIRQTDDVL